MIRINLLPWREERRKARRQQFFAVSGLIAVLVGVIWFAGFGVLNGYSAAQDQKNAFLKSEITLLDKDIDEIKRLKEQTDSLLSRKRIIESLQANRTETVHLFNELARKAPDGIYLKSLKQSGARVSVTGYTQTNARVSSFMRNIDGSPILERPDLVEIKAATVGNRRLMEFSLNLYISRKTTEDGERGGKAKDKKS